MHAKFIRGVIGSTDFLKDERPHIAFVGRSNVGKSSVINTLTERKDLAKSSSTPGKTQQINMFLIDNKFYFVDLPGFGFAKLSQKQREKIRRMILWYLTSGEAKIALVALIIDSKIGFTQFDQELIKILNEYNLSHIILLNKADKRTQKELAKTTKDLSAIIDTHNVYTFSSKSGKGKSEVLKRIMKEI